MSIKSKQMTQYLSDKIKLLSFILIIMVLYIHSGFHANEIEGMYWNNFIQKFISDKLGRIAVPLFFIISGYLFFLKTEYKLRSIIKKIKSRINSLLLPYIYACIFFFVAITIVQMLPGISSYVNSDTTLILKTTIPNIIKNIFWIADSGNGPMAFHLWFLRDLIVIVALSPIVYYMLVFFKWWFILLLFILSFFPIIVPYSLISSLFWFSFGGVFVITKTSVEFKKTKWSLVILFLFITISFIEIIVDKMYYLEYLQKILILLGITGVWFCYDYFISHKFSLKKKKWLSILCSFTFFIYLFHEPTINIVRKLIVIILGKNSSGYLISYLFSPFIFIILAVLAGSLLKKSIPKIYSNLVGGRI